MQESQKLFIQRHIRELIKQDIEPRYLLEKSLNILDDSKIAKQALVYFDETNSLTKTLHHLNVIQLDKPLLDAVAKQERNHSLKNVSFVTLLDANQTITETFKFLKARLSVGLGYALWLSLVATTIFSIISLKVLPQYREIFTSFGADLPSYTQLALDWQESLFSPDVIGGLFVLVVGFLLFSVNSLAKQKNLEKERIRIRLLKRIPFIKRVIEFSKDIRWLSQLKILLSTGMTIEQSLSQLPDQSGALKRHQPEMMNELKAAEKMDSLELEIDYQSNQLNQLAEQIVTKESRYLVSVVMAFVISYVVFTIFASYLPIFQLGAVI